MNGTTTTRLPLNQAGDKRHSSHGQGGLLHRMFGSNGKDSTSSNVASTDATALARTDSNISSASLQDGDTPQSPRKPSDTPDGKKRRSSGVGRARDLFSSAKQSLANLGSGSPESRGADRSPQTPIQKLSKTDPALSVPQGSLNNSAGESAPGPRSTFRVGVTEDKNKKCRRTMEDTHAYLYNFMSTPAPALTGGPITPAASRDSTVSSRGTTASSNDMIETDNGYFAIFDGHAGTFAADWCGKKVHLLLEDMIRKNPNTPIPELLDMTFTNVDQQLEKLPLKNSGCTAVCAVLRWEDRVANAQSATGSTAIATAVAAAEKSSEETQSASQMKESASRQRVLYTANVGDARIVLCRNGKALRLSYDHKGSDENEGKRIAGAGGLILNNRVNGVLAVTRALGDAYMKDLVTGHPYTTETVIQPDIDEFLILACDGLWDVCTDQEAVDLVRHVQDPQAASKALVDYALARFSTDNLSCMLVRFDNKAVQEAVEHKVEPIGVEGDVSSQGAQTEAQTIVASSKKSMEEGGLDPTDRIPADLIEEPEPPEAGPEIELNPAAVEAAHIPAPSTAEGKQDAQMSASHTTPEQASSAPPTTTHVTAQDDIATSPRSQAPLSSSSTPPPPAAAAAATGAPVFVAPSSYLRTVSAPRPSIARNSTSAMQRQRDSQLEQDQIEGLQAIRAFLKVRTTYDVLPLSYRLIVLDTSLLVKKSLNILIQCGIVSAPLWDSKTSTFAGLLSTSDYLNVIQYYWQNPTMLSQVDQFRLDSLRDIERAIGVTPIETVSVHPLKSLYEACRRMLESRARRIPLVDIDDETQREMIVSVLTQYRILKFITINVTHTALLRKPLRDLKIGTYTGLQTTTMETPVIEVIQQLVTRSISSVPILDKDGTVMNLFEAVDVIALIKGGDYENGLRESVGKAIERRSEDFPGIYTCTLSDRLDAIFNTIRMSRVHRLVIIDESRHLVGLLSLSDILDYTLNSPLPEDQAS